VVERDPALLPGLTAGQWQGRARLVFAASIGLLLVTLGALGFGWRPYPVVLIVPGVVVLAGFVTWIVLGEFALRRMRAEHDNGYSTTLDLNEIDLRDPRTGAVVRAAGEPPIQPRRDALVWRMLQFPRGSLLDRRQSPSPPSD
jgi:hypothetical protein